jgi:thioredoxin 1
MSIPTLLIFENGEVVNKMMGFRPKKDLLAEIGL